MEKSNISSSFVETSTHQTHAEEKWSWPASIAFVVLLSVAGWTGIAVLFL